MLKESESPRSNAPLLFLFIGSGCAALIYEIVWFQLLQLVIGLTTISLGILLGTFMGGMCLGSLLLPRFVGRGASPLKVYAALEVGIAVLGILILFGLPWLAEFYSAAGGRGIFVRVLVAVVCLLPPTVLMGATLPAIARTIEATPRGASQLGYFYAGNILGAVIGCLAAGFYLLRVHDMAFATFVAAGLNLVVAAVAFLIAKNYPAEASEVEEGAAVRGDWMVYVAIALSGFGALGAEVIWTRQLSLLLGGTVYTFSIILAVFLAGLGIGSNLASLAASRMERVRVAFAWCQVLLLFACGWSAYAICVWLPAWPVNPSLSRSPWTMFQLDMARCLWAILPATILWGASFPLALACVAKGGDSGRLVGRLYAANTVGAIFGALMFALVLIPKMGTNGAQGLLLVIPFVAALMLLPRGPRSIPAIAVLMFGLIIGLINVPKLPWGLAAYGRYIATYSKKLAPDVLGNETDISASDPHEIFCTYLGEGMNGTVAVTKTSSGVRSFHSAGKIQASNDSRDMRLQRMLGHLSALAHAKPESVLVVACGAGVTAGTFTQHPETKRIVICDIEPLVPLEVAPRFAVENFNVVNDARTEVIFDDGRHFIRTTNEKFDVITSDPIDPWVKGCAALNTVEYYEMCKGRLNPGGVMSLWLPLYEMDVAASKSMIATFFKVFPNGMIFANDDDDGLGYDAVLLAQVEGTKLDVDGLQGRLDRADHAKVKKSMNDVGFGSAMSLMTTFAGQARDLGEWTRGAELNTDRSLRLQYLAGFSLNSHEEVNIREQIGEHYKWPENVFVGDGKRKEMLKIHLGDIHKGVER